MYSILKFFALGFLSKAALACSSGNPNESNPWSVQLEQSTITINNGFTASITGASDDHGYSINVVGNTGNVTQGDKTVSVVVNNQIPWGSNLTLYSIIGADSSGILMGWAYCDQAGQLTDMWLEETSGSSGFTNSTVSGTCNISSSSQDVNFTTPNQCIVIDPPSNYPSIQGPEISLKPHDPGSITLGQEYNLLPFTVVDCTNCGQTFQEGWVEVHSVLSGKNSSNNCIGILYLYVQRAPVSISYLNCFEKQEDSLKTFAADYNYPALNGGGSSTNHASGKISSSMTAVTLVVGLLAAISV